MRLLNILEQIKSRKLNPVSVVVILSIFLVFIRWRTLSDFCFKFSDNDQLVLWDAADDMRHGIFREPCFYGQAYNPLVEPLFALPLIFLRFPYRIALALISGLLGFLPYALLGWACFIRKQYIACGFACIFLLWLPIEFQVITSIPRGFIPSCAFASVGVYFAFHNRYNL